MKSNPTKNEKNDTSDLELAKTGNNESNTRRGTASPDVDIFESDTEFLLVANLPGVDNGDVRLELDGPELGLYATRLGEPEGKELSIKYIPSDYARSFRLSQRIDTDGLSASMKDGVLTVHLPKVPEAKPRQITVH